MENDLIPGSSTRRSLHVDIEKSQAMLDAPVLNEEQKRQFTEALWEIIVACVDLGLRVHPVQLACGKLENDEPQSPVARPDVLDSPHNPTSKFTAATSAERDERA